MAQVQFRPTVVKNIEPGAMGAPLSLTCEDCGALVENSTQGTDYHNSFHSRIDAIADDAFNGGGLLA